MPIKILVLGGGILWGVGVCVCVCVVCVPIYFCGHGDFSDTKSTRFVLVMRFATVPRWGDDGDKLDEGLSGTGFQTFVCYLPGVQPVRTCICRHYWNGRNIFVHKLFAVIQNSKTCWKEGSEMLEGFCSLRKMLWLSGTTAWPPPPIALQGIAIPMFFR